MTERLAMLILVGVIGAVMIADYAIYAIRQRRKG